MRKRLRKKKHLAEFRQLGFELAFRYHDESEDSNDRLVEAFLVEAIEARDLQFGGGGGLGSWEGFATPAARYGSATESDREAVRAWLETRPEVTEVRIGPLRDAHHGW